MEIGSISKEETGNNPESYFNTLLKYWDNIDHDSDADGNKVFLDDLLSRSGRIFFITDLPNKTISISKGTLPTKYNFEGKNLLGSFQNFYNIFIPESKEFLLWNTEKQYKWLEQLSTEQKTKCTIVYTFFAQFNNMEPRFMAARSTVTALNSQGQVTHRLHEWSDTLLEPSDIKNLVFLHRTPGDADIIYCYENNDPETEKTISRAEQAVWHALVKYDSVEKVAEALFVSQNTIESHRKSLFKKLGMSSVKTLIKLYIALGLNG